MVQYDLLSIQEVESNYMIVLLLKLNKQTSDYLAIFTN